MTKTPFAALAVHTAALVGLAAFSSPAEAGCTMQRQCVLKQRIEYRMQQQRSCDTVRRYEGRMFVPRTYCSTRTIRAPYPVAYQDCSQVRRVCSGLDSLIRSNRRR